MGDLVPAITFTKGEVERDVPQPKQPKNLQGLLRYAMAASDGTSEPNLGPIDDERRKFLEEAIKSITVDVIALLHQQIKILKDAENLDASADITEQTGALNTILQYVNDVDVANDFHKIGGFLIFHSCLKCVRTELRVGACDILAEVCQNNPYCQQVAIDNDFISLLLGILRTDQEDSVCVKALYAISCIVRQNVEGYNQFVQCDGLETLSGVIQREDERLRTKGNFLLVALCSSYPDLKEKLVASGYVPILINLSTKALNEHTLRLLHILIEGNALALNESNEPKYKLKEALENHLKLTRDKDQYSEEEELCKNLLNVLAN